MSDEKKSYSPLSRSRRRSPHRRTSPTLSINSVISDIYNPIRRRSILPTDITSIVRDYTDYGQPTLGLLLDSDPLGVITRGIPSGPDGLRAYTMDVLMEYLYLSIEYDRLTRAATLMLHLLDQGIIINPEVVELLIHRINRHPSPELVSLLIVSALSGATIPLVTIADQDVADEVDEMREQSQRVGNVLSPQAMAYGSLSGSGLLPRPPRPPRRRRRHGFQPRNTL